MAAAGWYPDPTGQHELRWFDGAQWTHHTAGAAPAAPAVPAAPTPAHHLVERPPAQAARATSPAPRRRPANVAARAAGLARIGLGVAVFVVCSIVQGAGGSNMFTSSFERPDNPLLELGMQMTWWPGWIATVGLVLSGLLGLLGVLDSD
jgi:hypothetical protein